MALVHSIDENENAAQRSWLTTIPASYFVVADQLDYTHTLPGGEAGGSGLYLEVVELRCGTINESGCKESPTGSELAGS